MSEWETFCDPCYYDLWRVRRKNERGFNDGYHIHNGEEARALVELLNGHERELDAERALADRLAEAANVVIDQWETPNWKLTEPTATCMNTLRNTLAAWKESRQDRNHS